MLKHIGVGAYDHRNMSSSKKYVNVGAPIIEVSKHMSIKEYRHLDKFSSKLVDIGAYNYQRM